MVIVVGILSHGEHMHDQITFENTVNNGVIIIDGI